MPGAVFLHDQPTYQGVQGEGISSDITGLNTAWSGSHFSFVVWLAVIGVLVPALIIGGLKVGGFQFVFRSR
jgi:hypothetical protein